MVGKVAGKKRRLPEPVAPEDYNASDEGGGDSDDGSVDLPGVVKKGPKKERKKLKGGEAVSFGEAMRTALGRHVPATSATPILAGVKKNKALEKELEEKKAEKETAKLAVAKQKWFAKERVVPEAADLNHERLLLKIATKGAVQLFNAVQKQQKVRQEEKGRDVVPPKPDKLTKGQFLDMLKGKGDAAAKGAAVAGKGAEAEGEGSAAEEEEDYEEEEEEEEEEEGEMEFDDDGESENEIEEDSEEEWDD